jgi:hypothetical protein
VVLDRRDEGGGEARGLGAEHLEHEHNDNEHNNNNDDDHDRGTTTANGSTDNRAPTDRAADRPAH